MLFTPKSHNSVKKLSGTPWLFGIETEFRYESLIFPRTVGKVNDTSKSSSIPLIQEYRNM